MNRIFRVIREAGGRQTRFNDTGSVFIKSKPSSPYEQHAGTKWENTKKVVEHSPYTLDVSRAEVHEAIANLFTPELGAELEQNLNARFPQEVWGEIFPEQHVLQTLVEALMKEEESQ